MSYTKAALISESETHDVKITKSVLINKSDAGGAPETDLIGDILDNCRSWQIRTILIIYLTKIPTAFFMACIVYTAPIPQRINIFCNAVTVTDKGSVNSVITIMHPPITSIYDKEFDISYCDTLTDIKDHARIYYGNQRHEMPWIAPNLSLLAEDVYNLSDIPCDIFNVKSGISVTTFDVVCSRGGLVILTQGMHLVGIFLSGIIARYFMKV